MNSVRRGSRGFLGGLMLAASVAGVLFGGCQGKPEEQTQVQAQPPRERPLLVEGVVIRELAPTRAIVSWSTTIPSNGPVLFGDSPESLGRSVPAPALTKLHRVVFDSLEPGRDYFYVVVARSRGGQEVRSDTLSLRTPAVAAEPTDEEFDVAVLETEYGTIVIRFFEDTAPRHSANFKKLAREGFYDGTTFHRIMDGVLIQGGDPNSRDNEERRTHGLGGPGYTIPAEIGRRHERGSVAAAQKDNPERESNGSQFYICLQPQPHLDRYYTVFGRVIDGIEVAQEISELPVDGLNNPLHSVPMTVRIERRRLSDFY